jgi:hypothetical protein
LRQLLPVFCLPANPAPADPAACGCHSTAPNAFVYTSNVTGQTYTLNTSFVSQADAERQCACTGGHLVSYTSQDEQQDVRRLASSRAAAGVA